MRRWQRVGLTKTELENTIVNGDHTFDLARAAVSESDCDWEFINSQVVYAAYRTLLLHHFQFLPSRNDAADAVRLVCASCQRYFFGESGCASVVRGKVDRRHCQMTWGWMEEYRIGLLGTLLSQDNEAMLQITVWPANDLPPDAGTSALQEGDILYHVALAEQLRGTEPTSQFESGRASSPRLRTLTDALTAIQERDNESFCGSIVQHLEEFQAGRNLADESLTGRVSIDASILTAVAAKYGVEVPELPESLGDLVVRRETVFESA